MFICYTYTYTYIHIHTIHIYTQYFTCIYGLSSKGLGYFLVHQASQSFVRKGALFYRLAFDAYSKQFLLLLSTNFAHFS